MKARAFQKKILVRIHAHLKGIMSSEIMVIKVSIIFYSSQSFFDIFAKLLLLMKDI